MDPAPGASGVEDDGVAPRSVGRHSQGVWGGPAIPDDIFRFDRDDAVIGGGTRHEEENEGDEDERDRDDEDDASELVHLVGE